MTNTTTKTTPSAPGSLVSLKDSQKATKDRQSTPWLLNKYYHILNTCMFAKALSLYCSNHLWFLSTSFLNDCVFIK